MYLSKRKDLKDSEISSKQSFKNEESSSFWLLTDYIKERLRSLGILE